MQDLYEENFKIRLKGTKDCMNKWKGIACSWIEKWNIIKMLILLEFTYKFNMILSNTAIFFWQNSQADTFIVKCKGPKIVNIILKKNKSSAYTTKY